MAKSVYQILLQLEGQQQARAGLNQLGQAAGLTGAAFLALSAQATKAAADYEFALTKVNTVANESTGTAQELDQAFSDLSDNLDGNLSKLEASTAAYDVLSAGFKDQTEVIGILEASQQAAIGGFSDLATVSDAVTTALNAYGDQLGENLTVTERTRLVTDQLIATQNEGKITVAEQARQLGNLVATAATAKVPFNELNAAVAQATSRGVRAQASYAGLNQIIAAVAKPTGDAAREAKRLGIEFNAAALESQGLVGLMQTITEAGGGTTESLTRLFGSIEAVKVAANLTGESFDSFVTKNQAVANSAGLTEQAYSKMADTVSVKADAALKTLNNTLVDLGQGTLVALEPAISALSFLVQSFNSLPGPIKSAIGILIASSGAVLTVSGAVLLLSAQWGVLQAQYAASVPVITSLTAALTAKATALAATATSAGALNLALIPLATTVGLLATAVAAATLAWKNYENIQLEATSNAIRGAQVETEILAQKATQLGMRMQETGEALPVQQYEQFRALLVQANSEVAKNADGTGVLDGIIASLDRTQAKYTQTTVASTAATQESTQSLEEQAEALETLITSNQEAISAIDARTAAEVSRLTSAVGSEEERIRQSVSLETTATQEKTALLNELLNSQGLTDQQREQLTIQRTQLEVDEANRVFQAQERMQQLTQQRERSLTESAIQSTEARLATQEITEVEALQRISRLRREQAESDIEFINRQLQGTTSGSAEEAQLQADRARLNTEIAQGRQQLQDDIERINQESLRTQLQDFRTTEAAKRSEIETSASFQRLQATAIQDQATFTDSLFGSLSRVGDLLADENLKRRERNQLTTTARDITNTLRDQGVQINRNLSIEQQIQQALAQQDLIRLNFKQQQLNLSAQQLQVDQELKRLEIEATSAESRALLSSGTLSDSEAAAERAKLEASSQRLQILDRETSIRERQLNLQQQQLDVERSLSQVSANLNLAGAGLSPLRGSGRTPAPSLGGTSSSSGQPTLQALREVSQATSKTERTITTTSQATITQLTTLNRNQATSTQAIQRQTASTTQNLTILRSMDTNLAALRLNTGTIINQINDIKNQLGQLPSAIGRQIPAPVAAPRSR